MDKRSSKTLAKIYEGFSICLQNSPYSSIKVRDVIKEAKISPTGFYAHFKSKEEVLRGLLANVFLTVKCRKFGENDEERLDLLFIRIEANGLFLSSFLIIQENKDTLRNALIPWCRSFLPTSLPKQTKSLCSCFIADALINYLKEDEKDDKLEIQDAIKKALSAFFN